MLPLCIKFVRNKIIKRILIGVLVKHKSKLKQNVVTCIERFMLQDIDELVVSLGSELYIYTIDLSNVHST
ncbi:hypothetical protein, partial [Staphylococcus pseudintermedius]|uniref:hypothetical protein n=1 Tax=Staphylococcus pseudintermedius TaxID=283734 RepID=UPI001E5A22F1